MRIGSWLWREERREEKGAGSNTYGRGGEGRGEGKGSEEGDWRTGLEGEGAKRRRYVRMCGVWEAGAGLSVALPSPPLSVCVG